MDAWDGWPFAGLYLLLVAVAFLVVGAQVFLFHWRTAFRSKARRADDWPLMDRLAAELKFVDELRRAGLD